MERRGDETHIETDEARGGESTGVMRWVLGISLLLAIGLLSAIWIFGAATQGDVESEVTASGAQTAMDDGGEGTDSILGTDPAETEAVNAEETAPETTQN
jgi:hypothetical protein